MDYFKRSHSPLIKMISTTDTGDIPRSIKISNCDFQDEHGSQSLLIDSMPVFDKKIMSSTAMNFNGLLLDITDQFAFIDFEITNNWIQNCQFIGPGTSLMYISGNGAVAFEKNIVLNVGFLSSLQTVYQSSEGTYHYYPISQEIGVL